jgi:hypothetical protein
LHTPNKWLALEIIETNAIKTTHARLQCMLAQWQNDRTIYKLGIKQNNNKNSTTKG